MSTVERFEVCLDAEDLTRIGNAGEERSPAVFMKPAIDLTTICSVTGSRCLVCRLMRPVCLNSTCLDSPWVMISSVEAALRAPSPALVELVSCVVGDPARRPG